jgi:4-amino-4-deoxy-L-arabinose transferase-like glycosyltransferase
MLLVLFLLAVLTAITRQRLPWYLLSGIVLGIASLVRSTALLFPAFLLLYFALLQRPKPGLAIAAMRTGTIWLGALLVLSPWIIRNYRLVGEFVPTASVAGVSAHAGQYICQHLSLKNNLVDIDRDAALERAALARAQGLHFKEVSPLYYLYFYDARDELTFNDSLARLVIDRYGASPAMIAECMTKNLFHFWFSSKSWNSTMMNALVQVPYLLLAGYGLFLGLRSSRAPAVALLLLFCVYTIGVYLPILAQARYSVQLIPLLAVFAALAVDRLWPPPLRGADEVSNIRTGNHRHVG